MGPADSSRTHHALAHAKVNLWLNVVGRRSDGYHLLDSLVAFVDLSDRIEARPADRAFIRSLKTPGPTEADAEAYLARQLKFDPDIWIVEVEDRAGRNFLDTVVA